MRTVVDWKSYKFTDQLEEGDYLIATKTSQKADSVEVSVGAFFKEGTIVSASEQYEDDLDTDYFEKTVSTEDMTAEERLLAAIFGTKNYRVLRTGFYFKNKCGFDYAPVTNDTIFYAPLPSAPSGFLNQNELEKKRAFENEERRKRQHERFVSGVDDTEPVAEVREILNKGFETGSFHNILNFTEYTGEFFTNLTKDELNTAISNMREYLRCIEAVATVLHQFGATDDPERNEKWDEICEVLKKKRLYTYYDRYFKLYVPKDFTREDIDTMYDEYISEQSSSNDIPDELAERILEYESACKEYYSKMFGNDYGYLSHKKGCYYGKLYGFSLRQKELCVPDIIMISHNKIQERVMREFVLIGTLGCTCYKSRIKPIPKSDEDDEDIDE